VLRAQAAKERGDPGLAQTILEGVVNAEPQNAVAWMGLARAATNRQTYLGAVFVLGHLVPPHLH